VRFLRLLVDGVCKRYGGSKKDEVSYALRDVCLDIGPGIIGLLGPNGAGKSTLMRIIATITRPTHGTVLWNAVDIVKEPDVIRSVLGYLPQDFGVYPNLNADEFLHYMAAIKGLDRRAADERIDDLLEFINLVEVRRRPLGEFSGGMKQRIGIAQALLNDPRILIVDEPTVGLDTESRIRFRHLLAELAGDRIVVLSTHIVSDVDAAANDIAIINRGHLLCRSSPEDLLQLVEGKVWEGVIPSTQLPSVKQVYLLSSIIHQKDGLHIRLIADSEPSIQARSEASPTLEEAYLYTISRSKEAVPG